MRSPDDVMYQESARCERAERAEDSELSVLSGYKGKMVRLSCRGCDKNAFLIVECKAKSLRVRIGMPRFEG